MEKIKLSISSKELANLCKRYYIRRLAFFGSVLRDDFSASSDVDIQDDLSKLLDGREVDLVTPKFLNHRIRDKALGSS